MAPSVVRSGGLWLARGEGPVVLGGGGLGGLGVWGRGLGWGGVGLGGVGGFGGWFWMVLRSFRECRPRNQHHMYCSELLPKQ